ncbi:hypothetical protein CL618_02755 [archaeon]|nr:hypothetical protein [archaeon]|tara:strand:+ start:954 stop:1670 length:717 start_codon:yes stop_codon:yes gene_type:complete
MEKPSKQIKKDLASFYIGDEAKFYNHIRSNSPRKNMVLDIQKSIFSKFLKSCPKGKLLDVACGTGRFFHLYGDREIYGVDISQDMLNNASKLNLAKKLVLSDAEKLPFEDNYFDVTICSQFIMHTPYYVDVIKEMLRVTKKGGHLILDFPNNFSISAILTKGRMKFKKQRKFNLFSIFYLRKLFKSLNLEVIEYQGTLVFSPYFLPKSLVSVSKLINSFLRKYLKLFSYTYYFHLIKK